MQILSHRWLLLAVLFGCMGRQAEAKPAPILDIADTVAKIPILTKMSAMIQGSDLATFLSSKGPFTLFAPTDSAFSKLPPGTLDTLLRPENKVRLQDILLFHLVNGRKLTAKDLLTTASLLSCEGNPLAIKQSKSGSQWVLNAKLVHADIKCQNGIIDEIDTVLMPPETSMPPVAPPPPPPPVTNAPPINPATGTNETPAVTPDQPADTNMPFIPVAPIATPEVSPH